MSDVIADSPSANEATSALIASVCQGRREYALPPFVRVRAENVARRTLALLFPHFASEASAAPTAVGEEVEALEQAVRAALGLAPGTPDVSTAYIAALAGVRAELLLDARATWEGDPAAQSVDEVILAYPGFLATAIYRLAHVLADLGAPLLPRLFTELAHRHTGIDIHPGARLGRSLSIDHGTGIVIGETAVLGDRVKLYQGVTLGALSVSKALARRKRHPTIGNDVVIYANATILGGETVVGDGSVIGGNVWLTHSVPPGSIVTHAGMDERQRSAQDDLLEYHI
jgi:serine O-acetyltransferase